MMRGGTPTAPDRHVARDVLDNDVWQDESGVWWEREYWPIKDGYASSTNQLKIYSQYYEHALDLKETIFRRTGITLQRDFTDPYALCMEALSLRGVARYRPSQELVELIEQSQWHERSRERFNLADILAGKAGTKRGAHIYSVLCPDMWNACYDDALPLYVGQTTRGVQQRLKQHIAQQSPIGQYLSSGLRYDQPLAVDIITIATQGYNSLNTAEQHFIRELQPRYNIQHREGAA